MSHGYDNVRAVAISRDDFQSVNGVGVANHIIKYAGTVFLHPLSLLEILGNK